MEYKELEFRALPLNNWQIFRWENYISIDSIFDKARSISTGELRIHSKSDFGLFQKLEIEYNYFTCFEKNIFLANQEKQIISEIDLNSLAKKDFIGKLLPEYFWQDSTCFHNIETHTYQIFDKENNFRNEIKVESPLGFRCCVSGILTWYNDKKKGSWIECRNPKTNDLLWRKNFDWQFVRIEVFQDRIILLYYSYEKKRTDAGYEGQRDWHNPKKYTIAINTLNGVEVWRHSFAFSQIDKEYEIVLAGDDFIYEVELYSGELLNKVEVKPGYNLGYFPQFMDSKSYYYTFFNGKFGSINKEDGKVDWEIHLEDRKGIKRKLGGFFLLRNGNLLLSTLPNHKNGDVVCLFNPLKNLNYSRIER